MVSSSVGIGTVWHNVTKQGSHHKVTLKGLKGPYRLEMEPYIQQETTSALNMHTHK